MFCKKKNVFGRNFGRKVSEENPSGDAAEENHDAGVDLVDAHADECGKEKEDAIKSLGGKVEITRFKGLGEISSDEFKDFIGPEMRLDLVKLAEEESIGEIMLFYMGDNTIERQHFIMDNLRSEEELEDVDI